MTTTEQTIKRAQADLAQGTPKGWARFNALPQELKIEIEKGLIQLGKTSQQFMVDLLDEMTEREYKFWLFSSLNPETLHFS